MMTWLKQGKDKKIEDNIIWKNVRNVRNLFKLKRRNSWHHN